MKRYTLLFLVFIGIFLALPAKSVFREEFTVSQSLRSPGSLDFNFTSAWYDSLGRRVIASRTYGARQLPLSALEKFMCDAKKLISDHNLTLLERNIGCKVTPSGVLLFGFSRDEISKDWVGRIYLIEAGKATLLHSPSLFSDKRLGSFSIGVKNSNEFLVIYTISPARFFSFRSGVWREEANNELKELRVSSRTQVAWSGNAWFFSGGGRNLSYFDGLILVNVFGQVPRVDFGIHSLETDVSGGGMIIADGKEVFLIQDNGYGAGMSVESRTIRARGTFDVVELTLSHDASTPSGSSLTYLFSPDNGDHWFSGNAGERVLFSTTGRELRWKAVFSSSSPNVTSILRELTIHYVTEDASGKRTSSRDSKRVSDLSRVDGYLKAYFDEVGSDPLMQEELSHRRENIWAKLKTALVSQAGNQREGQSRKRSIEGSFPAQPTDGLLYGYWTDGAGKNFILYVTLEEEENSALRKDIDGVILDINCDDPVYCIGRGISVAKQKEQSTRDRLIRYVNDYRVYFLKNGVKQWVKDEKAFARRKLKWENVEVLSTQQDLDRYPTGSPLR